MAFGRTLLTLALATAVTGCADGSVSRGALGDDLAPPRSDLRGDGIDPVIVGDRLLAAGEAELALASYLDAAGRAGLTPDLMRSMASANIRLGRLGQAERLLRDAVAAAPEDAAAWNDLGVVLMERGEVAEARQAFRRAFALDPDKPQILANLRLSLARLEETRYSEAHQYAFTLTRRQDGVFELTVAQ